MEEEHSSQRAENRHSPGSTGRWIAAGRFAWAIFAILVLVLFARGVPVIVGQIEHCSHESCPTVGMSFSPDAAPSVTALHRFAIYMVALWGSSLLILCILSLVLLRRKVDQRIALVVAFLLVGFSGAAFNPTISAVSTLGGAWYWAATFAECVGSAAVFPFFCMLPDGHFVPRWTRLIAGGWIVACAITYFVPPTPFFVAANNDSSSMGLPLIATVFFIASVAGQVHRYRHHASSHQRQQIKWVVGGIFIALLCLLLTILGPQAVGLDLNGFNAQVVGNGLMMLVLLMVPAAIVMAIVKTRLWDIDRIINRALVYGSLSACLIGTYAGVVILLQRLLGPLTGRSDLAIALSTLAVAALFNPARHHIQTVVDRRFYRQKYDAEYALASFGLAARDEVDLARLTGVLAGVISETVQPEHLSVWLRDHESIDMNSREGASQ